MAKSKNIYKVPILKKDRIVVMSDSHAHYGVLKHSIDFLLPLGTKIYVAQDGEVIDVKDDSNKGGPEDKYNYAKFLNMITIKHRNNEYSEYSHIKYRGALVKVGQKVSIGEPIGLSGNTGYTTAPHLHFHVFKKTNTKIGWNTLEIRFDEPLKVKRKDSDFTKKDDKIIQKMSVYKSR